MNNKVTVQSNNYIFDSERPKITHMRQLLFDYVYTIFHITDIQI